ncbi:hypothetical protein J7F03_14485 [Streptomyces sp. ISL-43]|uniref:hypothetical protein n=1 Tax=Streptomyces sp. ISL-43 TaxID=2819183 RepID=UPI001BE5B69F|nr:hypothetical protein [Streptomyces sp. ISL-43]MBT2448264.1 hypothetical protein [Streptomyces sp. ISL-43]
MPRSRPGALRAVRNTAGDGRLPAWVRELPRVDRLSARASAEVHALESATAAHARGLSETRTLLAAYRAFLAQPGSRLRRRKAWCSCPGCEDEDVALVRDKLADRYRALSPRARAELGPVLADLDAEFRRRTEPDPHPPPEHRADRSGRPRSWWHRRRFEDA